MARLAQSLLRTSAEDRTEGEAVSRPARTPFNNEDEEAKRRIAEPDNLGCENLRPLLQEGFGKDVADKQAAERKRDVAVLKIPELIVAGEIPQRPNEDHFMTVCWVIGCGESEAKASAKTKRAIDQAVAAIIATNRWRTGPAEIVQKRTWRGKSAITRTILLLNALEKIIGPADLKGWLEAPNPNLDGTLQPISCIKGAG